MTASLPTVSVVLPFRNADATLVEALDSIATQTINDFECVLIDHASSDTSRTIADEYCARDRRFRVIEAKGSFVDALNLGVDSTRSPLIARMDADDRAHPERLAAQVQLLDSEPTLDIASCLVECFPQAQLADGMRRYQDWVNALVDDASIRNNLFVESPLPHPSVVVRRAAFDRYGAYADTDGPEDYDLWLRMLLAGARAGKVRRVLLYWRETGGRMSRTDPRYGKKRFFETKVRHFLSTVPPSTPLQIWGTGPNARRWARQLIAGGYEIRRFVDVFDKRVGSTVQGIAIEKPSALRREDGIILAAVGLLGARELIEEELTERGMEAGRDYICVA